MREMTEKMLKWNASLLIFAFSRIISFEKQPRRKERKL
jgi:hypothetical protein